MSDRQPVVKIGFVTANPVKCFYFKKIYWDKKISFKLLFSSN